MNGRGLADNNRHSMKITHLHIQQANFVLTLGSTSLPEEVAYLRLRINMIEHHEDG
ncbi:hypothetical protein D3C72_2321830 [compost metagenome]